MLEVLLQVLGAIVLTTMLVIAGGIYLFFSTTTPVEGSPTGRQPPTALNPTVSSEGEVQDDGATGEGLEAALHDIAATILPAVVDAVVGMKHPNPQTRKRLGTARLSPTGTAVFSHNLSTLGAGHTVCELDESARWLERVVQWATIALGCSMSSVHDEEDTGVHPSVGELVQAVCDKAIDGASLKLREKFKSDALCLSLRKLRLGEVRCEIDGVMVAAPKAPSLGGRHIHTQFCVDLRSSRGSKLGVGEFIRLPCASQPMYITIPFNWTDSDAYIRLSGIFPLLLNHKINERFSLAADFVTLTAAAAVSGIDLDGDVCVRLCLGCGPGEEDSTPSGEDGDSATTPATTKSDGSRPIVSVDFTFLKAPTLLMALQAGLGDELVENSVEVAATGGSVGGVEAPLTSQLSTSAAGSQHRLKPVPPPRGGTAQPAVGTARITRMARLHVTQALEKLTFPNVTRMTVSLKEDGKRAITTRRIKVPTGTSW